MLHPVRDVEKWQKQGVSLGIAIVRRTPRESLDPQIKSNNCLNTIIAKMEAKTLGVFEALLLNFSGHLTEGTTTNLFFLNRGILHTPSAACGLLPGVTRGSIISLARWNGFKVHEGRYRPADLERADEAFLTSSTLEVVPVTMLVQYAKGTTGLRRTSIGSGRPGPLTRRLHHYFQAAVKSELSL